MGIMKRADIDLCNISMELIGQYREFNTKYPDMLTIEEFLSHIERRAKELNK